MPFSAVTVLAPAKLNLALAVGAREPDGMHPICSWMVSIDLYDELFVTRLPPGRISRYAILWHEEARRRSEIDWSITEDLAVRAHLALETHLGRDLPVQLKLEKRIPAGAGLGGGSSDAAAMLHAVNRLFDLDLDESTLMDVAAGIGSDVPFLVRGGSAIVEGRGERLTPHGGSPDLNAAIIVPDCRCATKNVYRRFDELPADPLRADCVRRLATDGTVVPDPEAMFNDLTRAAILEAPTLETHLGQVAATAGRPALLSGSGSTIFVVCDDELHAEYLVSAIEKTHDVPAIAVRATAGIPEVVSHDAPVSRSVD